MKTAFLILAHKEPEQLAHLVKLLKTERSGVFVHIDRKAQINEFKHSFKQTGVHPTYLIQKVDIVYSSFRYITATLLLLQEAFRQKYDYFVLLGGQDYPIKTINHILDFFTENSQLNYMQYETIPTANLGLAGLYRTNNYSFILNGINQTLFPWKGHAKNLSFKGKTLNLLLYIRNFGNTQREFPLGMQPYYASQWWNLSHEAVGYILNFIRENPAYTKYHKHALHPEEMFFQSIVLNNKALKEYTVNSNLRYIKWIKGEKHPEYIDELTLFNLKNQNFLFARKLKNITK